ncbi:MULTISPECIES: lipoprotein insertase outer membrane protein LolB [Rhodanobacter]|uniref:lipoprotein insertase outer membrane protein LolB n=1 Tax=Rhodanobacter TaxID=75309 RepID=UPI000403229F|nr:MULTISPECIES: lipoprotein insertase outer membrane protein LolB [Rhodanobacter]TAN14499.1 MAG: outer membrane lipoprotein LolB [Rhodanobacter sp.]UJJ55975.1 lipoprotein insertase outer membrane protein LolB [Rhodanobacter thiooxydans]
MRRWLRLLVAVALPLLLAACVPPAVRVKGDAALFDAQFAREHALARADHWELQGRLGVSNGKDGGSGSFSWTQDGAQYEFVLRGPAISGMNFRLSGGPDGALLEGVEHGPLRGPDAEALMHKALGWEVPLRDLRAWVLGLRADSGPAELSFGENRLPSLLQQDGWTVDYREWDEARQPPLPTKVFAGKPPFKVKLSIESWQFR